MEFILFLSDLMQSKEKVASKANEELEALRLKESQANNKAISETKRLKQELGQVKDRYAKQVSGIRGRSGQFLCFTFLLISGTWFPFNHWIRGSSFNIPFFFVMGRQKG